MELSTSQHSSARCIIDDGDEEEEEEERGIEGPLCGKRTPTLGKNTGAMKKVYTTH